MNDTNPKYQMGESVEVTVNGQPRRGTVVAFRWRNRQAPQARRGKPVAAQCWAYMIELESATVFDTKTVVARDESEISS
jgi:hypothetical protein